jgi:hypothetical protein
MHKRGEKMTAKKTEVKKTNKKETKTITKKKEKRRPTEAKPEHYFILVTGVPLKNLRELASSLENMNDWVFNHHVSDSRNDFSNWVKDVLEEHELSEEIKSIRHMKDMEIRILKHLVNKYL